MLGVDVFLDGTKVVSGGFAPSLKIVFEFALDDGTHKLDVKVAESQRALAATKSVEFELAGPRWDLVDISTARCDPCGPSNIAWTLRDHAP